MNVNLSRSLKHNALHFPQNLAYLFQNEEVTYKELDQMVDRFADNLAANGIGKGDFIALLLGNSPQFVIAYYGILRTGAVVVPINPSFTAREISYILSSSRAKGVIAQSALKSVLDSLKIELKDLQLTIYEKPIEGENCIELFLRDIEPVHLHEQLDEENLAVILYTSGTTGNPKGAMLTHRNIASNAVACNALFDMTPADRVITVLPMFHVFCMTVCMNAAVACGASMLIVPKFSPIEVVKTIRDQKATFFAGVPTMYNYMLQLQEFTQEDFASIRICIAGGAPLPVALLNQFKERYGIAICEGYGLSEASPVTAFNPYKGLMKAGSIGINIPGVENKIVDANRMEVPRGQIGEIVVSGPNVMKGYLGMPDATNTTIIDGWLYTGDMATMDEEGYIYIVDRKKDIILVGGYSVYPREVEEVLYQHPSIYETAVVGIADEQLGEVVKAFIVKKDPSLTESEVRSFLQDKLVKYKNPKYVEFLSELPKNSSGKIMRRSLRM